MRFFLLLFIIIPIFEIYLLIQVGGLIGAMPTVILIIFTAFIGVSLLKQQGLSTLARVQSTLAQGQIPAIEILEGIALLVGGALLLTPGFFTDILGFLALIPPLRRGIIAALIDKGITFAPSVNGQGFQFDNQNEHTFSQQSHQQRRTIEGEYTKGDE